VREREELEPEAAERVVFGSGGEAKGDWAMFESILGFWSGKDFLAQVLDDFSEMLRTAEKMYADVMGHFLIQRQEPEFRQSVYRRDQAINTLERKIRCRIISHLAVRPRVSLNACLVLMSVVKDAERLGDYSKNLLEAAEAIERPLDQGEFERFFGDIPQQIMGCFADTAKAFVESDEALARSVVRCQRGVAARCEQIWLELARSDLSPNHAVCLAVSARFMKRIALHLANIATAVVMPVSDLDYWDEAGRGEDEVARGAGDPLTGLETS